MLLRELFDFLPKSKRSASYGSSKGKYPFFTSSNIIEKYVTEPDYKGEFLIIGDGGTGNCKFYCGSFSVSDQNFLLRPRSKTNAHCVQYFLQRNNFKILNEGFKGVGIKNVSKTYIENIDYIYNHKFTENEIVSNLKRIEQTIENGQKQLVLLDELIKSRFIEMFGDPDANPFDWEIVTINDVCSSIVRGPFGSALKKEFFVPKSETTIKVYEQQHAIKKNDKLGTYYVTKEKYQSLKRFTCHEGDILMSCSGTMGELYQLPIGCEKGIINQALCKFTLNQKMLPIVFLESMKHVVDQIDKKGSGIQNIAAVSYVKSMKMCLPPIQIQKKFVTFYEQVDKSKFIVQKEIKDLQELLDKKMDEYFGQ